LGDEQLVVRGAAVQAAPVFLDREATLDKAIALIEEAGANGAQVVGFPEGFIPAHPLWFHFAPGGSRQATDLSVALFENSIEIPGPEVAALAAAAKRAGTYVVMGACEKIPGTFGTMYNTQVFISPTEGYLGKHQKLMPTGGERLVHAAGGPDTFGAFQTPFGPLTGLMCGENSNPLAVFALTAEGSRVHVMAWPNHIGQRSVPMPDTALNMARTFAQMSKAFVISACGVVDDRIVDMVAATDEDREFLARPDVAGGSCIIAPDTRILAGPVPGDQETIVYADMDFEIGIRMKLRHDLAGHYNRPDVFRLLVNKQAAPLMHEVAAGELSAPSAPALEPGEA
jgi:nitrilase